MKTAIQELIEQLTKEADFLTGPDDCKEDRMVGGYIRTIISDIKETFIEKEKSQIIEAHLSGQKFRIDNDNMDSEEYYNKFTQ